MKKNMMIVAMSMICFLGCGSSGSTGSAQNAQGGQGAATNPDAVAIQNFAFSPSTLTVSAGATVTWTNEDSGVPHTSTGDSSQWNSGDLSTGQTFSLQFTVPGTYTYHCNVHPGMHGTIVVQ